MRIVSDDCAGESRGRDRDVSTPLERDAFMPGWRNACHGCEEANGRLEGHARSMSTRRGRATSQIGSALLEPPRGSFGIANKYRTIFDLGAVIGARRGMEKAS